MPCNCGWWGWIRSFPAVEQALWWVFREGWTRGIEVEACKAECHSFVWEQRQLQQLSTRSAPDIGDALSFCSAQSGFCARQHLYRLCILSSHVCFIALAYVGFYCSWDCDVSGVLVNSTCDPWSCNSWREVYYQPWTCRHQGRRSAWCPALCAGFCSWPALHTEEFLLGIRLDYAFWVCGHRR